MKVAFYKGRKRLFNRVVSWWLRGPYSHCELVIGEQDGLSVCASSSFMDEGVRIKHMTLDQEHWDLIEVGGEPIKAQFWLMQHYDQPYDVIGLAGFIFRRVRQNNGKWFCSEAVASMLGMDDAWRFDPCSLHAALTRPVTDKGGHP